MALRVAAVARRLPSRLLQQPFAVVDPHGLRLTAGTRGQLADLHELFLETLTLHLLLGLHY